MGVIFKMYVIRFYISTNSEEWYIVCPFQSICYGRVITGLSYKDMRSFLLWGPRHLPKGYFSTRKVPVDSTS